MAVRSKLVVAFCFACVLLLGYIVWKKSLPSAALVDNERLLIQAAARPFVQEHTGLAATIRDFKLSSSGYDETFIARKRFLVIGAISYPGYVVSNTLKTIASKDDMKVTEDISSIGFDSGTWKNWDRLKDVGITPSIVDYADDKVINSHIEWLQDGTLVYIPSLYFNAIHGNSIFDLKQTTSLLKTFTNILETVKYRKVRIVHITPTRSHLQLNLHATAIRVFSLLLSSYSQKYTNIDVNFISFAAVENCDTQHNLFCCSPDELAEAITSSLSKKSIYNESKVILCGLKPSIEEPQHREIVASTYLTLHGIGYRKNSFQFMREFFMTAKHNNLDVLIFHDQMSTEFEHQLRTFYGKAETVRIKGLNGRSVNDARYYFLYDYLLHHPEIKGMILQDLKDGRFPSNPFKIMDAIGGDIAYFGKDLSFYVSEHDYMMRDVRFKVFLKCFGEFFKGDEANYQPLINAGTIGGTRDVMLTFLTRLKQCLDDWAPHKKNCNMACVGLVTHHHFLEQSFNGYPFQAPYKAGISIARGTGVAHKQGGYV